MADAREDRSASYKLRVCTPGFARNDRSGPKVGRQLVMMATPSCAVDQTHVAPKFTRHV